MPHRPRHLIAGAMVAGAATLFLAGCDTGPKYTGTATIRDLNHTAGHYTYYNQTAYVPDGRGGTRMSTTPQQMWHPASWEATACATIPDGTEHCWRRDIGQDFYTRTKVGDQVHLQDSQIQYVIATE